MDATILTDVHPDGVHAVGEARDVLLEDQVGEVHALLVEEPGELVDVGEHGEPEPVHLAQVRRTLGVRGGAPEPGLRSDREVVIGQVAELVEAPAAGGRIPPLAADVGERVLLDDLPDPGPVTDARDGDLVEPCPVLRQRDRPLVVGRDQHRLALLRGAEVVQEVDKGRLGSGGVGERTQRAYFENVPIDRELSMATHGIPWVPSSCTMLRPL